MMPDFTKCLLLLMMLLCGSVAKAQDAVVTSGKPFMEQNGKIYVVVAVVVTIVVGLLIYLIRLDRKITRLEKEAGVIPEYTD